MTPEEWARVKIIAGDAWALPPDQRTAFVTRLCADDPWLQHEVVSLLESMEAAGDEFEHGAAAPPSDVREDLAGRQLGPYTVLERIGAGGMGDVYRARDTRLDRLVALKVLSGDAGALASSERLRREARAVGALKHPNICTLHNVDHQDEVDFLVMEYLPGETLAARLSREPLPVAEALAYAEQIASALVAAHRAGIVHRDLTPRNVMLTSVEQGTGPAQAKLLDFGLAKASALADASAPGEAQVDRSTDLTLPGLLPGTPAYMAPEQIAGQTIDHRTDIFAFGALLFEMLTGRKAFPGDNGNDVTTAILEREPPLASSLQPDLPHDLDRIVQACLAKDPARRYASTAALLADLRAIRRESGSTAVGRWLLASVAFVMLTLVGAAWAARDVTPPAPMEIASLLRLPASAGVIESAVLSPDGEHLVFAWAGDGVDNPELVILNIGASTRQRLTHDPGVEEWPTWSPDGRQIAFIRCAPDQCGIFIIAASGGAERQVRALRLDRYYDLDWSPDGRSIAYAERESGSHPFGLFLLDVESGEARRLTSPRESGELRFAFSPNGRRLATIRLESGVAVHVISAEDGRGTALLSDLREWFGGVTWTGSGQHLILSGNQQGVRRLWRLPVAGGPLEQIAVAGDNAYYPSMSARGDRLAFVHELDDWDVSRLELVGGRTGVSSPVHNSTRLDLDPAYSPDGKFVAFVSERGGTREIWVSRADGSESRALTAMQGTFAGRPQWSPGGQWIAYHGSGIHVIGSTGGRPRRLTDDGEMPSWSADGQAIYFTRNRGGHQIWKVPLEEGTQGPVMVTPAITARETPDGRRLVFVRDGAIWQRPLPDGDEAIVTPFADAFAGYWQVVDDGIFYVTGDPRPDRANANHLKFHDFERRRSDDLGPLPGLLDAWVGGLSVSPDRTTVLYAHRAYRSREVVLVEHFR